MTFCQSASWSQVLCFGAGGKNRTNRKTEHLFSAGAAMLKENAAMCTFLIGTEFAVVLVYILFPGGYF